MGLSRGPERGAEFSRTVLPTDPGGVGIRIDLFRQPVRMGPPYQAFQIGLAIKIKENGLAISKFAEDGNATGQNRQPELPGLDNRQTEALPRRMR